MDLSNHFVNGRVNKIPIQNFMGRLLLPANRTGKRLLSSPHKCSLLSTPSPLKLFAPLHLQQVSKLLNWKSERERIEKRLACLEVSGPNTPRCYVSIRFPSFLRKYGSTCSPMSSITRST